MYRREKPLILKGSTSALCNNLSVQVNVDKNVISYAVVHKSVVNLVSASTDGSTVNHRQIVCKEPSATHGSSIVLQAKLVQMPKRTLLVITSQKGIQMFEPEGSLMLYWYALGETYASESESSFGRGVCGVEDDTVCVGTCEGQILAFYIPSRGTNITLSETLKGHNAAICALESEGDKMVSSDDLGNIMVWKVGERFRQLIKISGFGYPCSTVALWHDLVVAGYGSGHLRVFDAPSGNMVAEVSAHARWINALDVAIGSGTVVTVAEDSIVRVFQLKPGRQPEMTHLFSESISDLQLQGVKFINEDGRAFAVTGYDSNELIFFTKK